MSDAVDIVKEFLIESNENLDQLDNDLLELEKDPASVEILGSIFRTIHTIKGATGFLGFLNLETVAHAGESLLGRLREGKLKLTPDVTSGLLAMVDAVREMLAAIEASGQDGGNKYEDLIKALRRFQDEACETDLSASESPQTAESPAPLGQILIKSGQVSEEEVESALEAQQAGDPRHLGEILVERGCLPPSAVKDAIEEQKHGRASALASNTIRVDVGQLDRLMNLVGELVIVRNQIAQFSASQQDHAMLSASQRLNLITTELRESVMKTRMQPIGHVWSKAPRMVRDLSMSCGKQIRVEMEGEETELDRTIIEAINDPLMHMIRNSIDHGIEPPEVRTAAGKPPEGCLSLRAFHEGGQMNIEISDDGAGIDVGRVKQKAVERGIITPEQAAIMKERDAINLIFEPGFSTASKVTNISGRGVGMDVVWTNIEKIGGTVEIQTKAGLGSTLKIRIPLTLAIIPALIVTCRGERFAIPQVSLLELLRLEGNEARKKIEFVQGSPVLRLGGRLLPLVYLSQKLNLTAQADCENAVNIVTLQAGDHQFGLVVDSVNDTEEIVVKPLGKRLKKLSVYAGATIMGDGRVALILDVLGLARRAGVINESHDRRRVEDEEEKRMAPEEQIQKQTVLLFTGPGGGPMAMRLADVTQLEEFAESDVEQAGEQRIVRYRGGVLPLVYVSSLVEERRQRSRARATGDPKRKVTDAKFQVIVHSRNGQSVGLVVERILDIVEANPSTSRAASRKGASCSVVIQGKVTELLDLSALPQCDDKSLFAKEPAQLDCHAGPE